MEKYEQYKMLSYLLNALKNRSFFREHLSDIYDWHDNGGKNIIKFSWLDKTEEEKCIDFKDILRSQKKQALETGKKFVEALEKKVNIYASDFNVISVVAPVFIDWLTIQIF